MKIYLFCSAGMSTSILVKKMQSEADKRNLDAEIEAFSEATIRDNGPKADVILIGPQIKFKEKKIKQDFPNKPVSSIEMRAYGMGDGKAVLDFALNLLGK